MQIVSLPKYVIGQDAFDAIPSICLNFGKNLQIVGGKTGLASSINALKKSLKNSEINLMEPIWYGGECTDENIELLTKEIGDNGANIIAGLGGGKAIDTAKAVGDKLGLPVITIPTIASTCAGTSGLSVVYDKNHKFTRFIHFDAPPICSFINSQIIAEAPAEYFRAGMGDTLAKFYECSFAARGDSLNYTNGLGKTISHMCADPLFEHGRKALKDCEENKITPSLEQIIQAIIVNTGMVSILVDEDYNGAVAHSLFYGLTILPHIEEKYLHGDVVAYGILVQLVIDKKLDEAMKVRNFLKDIGCPTTLKDIEVKLDREYLSNVLIETVNGPDMKKIPYKIDENMVFDALSQIEKM
ncbi:iron-containing alcohol dehydrogenase family protein [Tissierella creatinini]|nr:iron-containing alcohol dehydrogenase family protein [Tissierella creatinini]TJX66489.1 iron-containing alcohol dehydrogenase family protein [Soehngenia saccharolytica]